MLRKSQLYSPSEASFTGFVLWAHSSVPQEMDVEAEDLKGSLYFSFLKAQSPKQKGIQIN